MKDIFKKWNEIDDGTKRIFWGVIFVLGFIGLLFLFIYYFFDFVSIQNMNENPDVRETNIQRFESLKLTLLIITPILTLSLFVNTINVQKMSSKNLRKDSMNRDFYNLLSLFKNEQKNSEKILIKLYGEIKSILSSRSSIKEKINFSEEILQECILENNHYTNQCPNYLKRIIEEKKEKKQRLLNKMTENHLIMEKKFGVYYPKTGAYFRIFHRLIKLINERFENKVIDAEEKMMYIGILRAQLSSNELLVVLVNSLETTKGLGLGIELMGNAFFGDTIDIETGQHFDCPDIYTKVLKKYFLDSHKAIKQRKKYKMKFMDVRLKIKNFDDLIKYNEKKPNVF